MIIVTNTETNATTPFDSWEAFLAANKEHEITEEACRAAGGSIKWGSQHKVEDTECLFELRRYSDLNKDRTRFSGLRVGDIITVDYDRDSVPSEVFDLSSQDEKRVQVRLPDGRVIYDAAEMITLITKVEDRQKGDNLSDYQGK